MGLMGDLAVYAMGVLCKYTVCCVGDICHCLAIDDHIFKYAMRSEGNEECHMNNCQCVDFDL